MSKKERNYEVFINDILEASQSISEYTQNYDFIKF